MTETYVNRQELINGLKEENLNLKIYIAKQLEYAKTIIIDLLNNSDEYCRQRAEDFIKEKQDDNPTACR